MTEASVVDLMPVGSATTFNVEFSENPEIYEINVTEEPYGQEPAEICVQQDLRWRAVDPTDEGLFEEGTTLHPSLGG